MSDSPMPAVRRARGQDLDRAAKTLGEAFGDDPWANWTIAADDHARRLIEVERLFLGSVARVGGEIWISEPDAAAVAAWLAPIGAPRPPPDPRFMAELNRIAGERSEAAAEARELVGAQLQALAPHWYLVLLGTLPSRRRQGLASAVLRPILERCDRGGEAAGLDTTERANLDFYARHGFETVSELRVPGGGPQVWILWREPRPARLDARPRRS